MSADHLVALARLPQPLGSILSHRLEHPQPRLGALVVELEQRPAHQALERLDHTSTGPAGTSRDLLRGVEREPTREDRDAPEDDLLVGSEQGVAPVQRGPHRLLAIRAAAPAVGEEVQLLPEARGHLFQGERAQPVCGQLDRERQASQLRADAGHSRRIAVGDPKTRPHVPATLHQQPDGFIPGEPFGRLPGLRIGPVEGRNRPLHLPGEAQRLPAGRQHV